MINRQKVRALRAMLEEKLKGFEGLHVELGSARFTSSSVTFKIEMSEVAEDGTVESPAVMAFRALAGVHGLSPDDLGREFDHNGRRFKVVGLNPKAKRYPVNCEQVGTGKAYKFSATTVRHLLAAKAWHDLE